MFIIFLNKKQILIPQFFVSYRILINSDYWEGLTNNYYIYITTHYIDYERIFEK